MGRIFHEQADVIADGEVANCRYINLLQLSRDTTSLGNYCLNFAWEHVVEGPAAGKWHTSQWDAQATFDLLQIWFKAMDKVFPA